MTELSKDEIELRKYEARISLINKGLMGLLGTITAALLTGLFSIYSSNQEAKTRLDLERLKAEKEIALKTYEVELTFIGKFMELGLDENVAVRLRFSEYLSLILVTPAMRDRWKLYHSVVKKEYDELAEKVKKLQAEHLKNKLQLEEAKKSTIYHKSVEPELEKFKKTKK